MKNNSINAEDMSKVIKNFQAEPVAFANCILGDIGNTKQIYNAVLLPEQTVLILGHFTLARLARHGAFQSKSLHTLSLTLINIRPRRGCY